MKLELNKTEFIKTNLNKIKDDVEIKFRIDASFGLQGQLLQLEKPTLLDRISAIHLLLGRLACIGEEWDYDDFNQENWASIFTPNKSLGLQILKDFEKVESNLFNEKLIQFKAHFLKKENEPEANMKSNLAFHKDYRLNGSNLSTLFKNIDQVQTVDELAIESYQVDNESIVYANRNKWNWQIWFVENDSYYYLFEETIIT